MRVTLLAALVLATLPVVGCKKVTKEQGTAAFHRELHLYFNNLNNDAQFRKDEFRKPDVRLGMTTATGSIYSTYTFDPAAFIVRNYKCRTCETKLLLTSPQVEYLCPSCGHSPYVTHPAGFVRKEAGCKTFDFGGAGRPDEVYRVRDFKAKFGGDLVNYGRNVCVHAPFRLGVSRAGYGLMRKFL